MGLFHLKKHNCIYSPFESICYPLSELNDGVFSKLLLGDGVYFDFKGIFVNSPCYGEIILIAKTRHAIGIRLENGAEILLHVGLETINLNGRGLNVLVKLGEYVRPGDQLIMIDRDVMEVNEIDLSTILVITNSIEYRFDQIKKGTVKNKEKLFEINKRV